MAAEMFFRPEVAMCKRQEAAEGPLARPRGAKTSASVSGKESDCGDVTWIVDSQPNSLRSKCPNSCLSFDDCHLHIDYINKLIRYLLQSVVSLDTSCTSFVAADRFSPTPPHGRNKDRLPLRSEQTSKETFHTIVCLRHLLPLQLRCLFLFFQSEQRWKRFIKSFMLQLLAGRLLASAWT